MLSSSQYYQSWPQTLLISTMALGLIYFSISGAELIKRNYDWNHFTETPEKSRYVKAESSSSQFNSNLLPQTLFTFTLIPPTPQNSPNSPSLPGKHPGSASASNLPPTAPSPLLRIRRSYNYGSSWDGQSQTPSPSQIQPHHRLRHEQKLNNMAIMNKIASSLRPCDGLSDCVNTNSTSTLPKKTLVLPTEECYHTGDVLIVVAITCLLNFSFVLVLWASVRWINYRPRRWSSSFSKRRRRERDRYCCWDEMSKSDSSSEEEDEDYETEDAHSQDNLIVKSYSMEDLRFYHG